MYEWTFFAEREAGGDGECESDGFDAESPGTEVAADDEAREDGLDLGNTGTGGL